MYKNPRGVLGVSADATREEVMHYASSQGKLVVQEKELSLTYGYSQIKQAFRKKSLQCHPDLCPPSQRPSAELAFRELAEAYAALSKGVPAVLCSRLLPDVSSMACWDACFQSIPSAGMWAPLLARDIQPEGRLLSCCT